MKNTVRLTVVTLTLAGGVALPATAQAAELPRRPAPTWQTPPRRVLPAHPIPPRWIPAYLKWTRAR